MKQIFLIIILLVNVGFSVAADYSKIDKQSETVPTDKKTTAEIAGYLTENLTSPIEKARAIFIWITHNITYDLDRMNTVVTYYDQQELADDALLRKKAVCSNYAALFYECCKSNGLKSYVIEGYVRQNGEPVYKGHAWNAVEIDAKFYNFDPTWATGFMRNGVFVTEYRDIFFKVDPMDFIKTHMPLDPIWQFSTNPISYQEFDTNNFQKLGIFSNFNFIDSIQMLSNLNTLEILERENLRISSYKVSNSYVNQEIRNLSAQISSENLKIQSDKYNQVVTYVNNAVNDFNTYIQLRSNDNNLNPENKKRFIDLLTSAHDEAQSAKVFATSITNWDKNLLNQITQLKNTINDMMWNINKELSEVRKH